MIEARVRVTVSIRVMSYSRLKVQSGGCTRSGGRVLGYELQVLQ